MKKSIKFILIKYIYQVLHPINILQVKIIYNLHILFFLNNYLSYFIYFQVSIF